MNKKWTGKRLYLAVSNEDHRCKDPEVDRYYARQFTGSVNSVPDYRRRVIKRFGLHAGENGSRYLRTPSRTKVVELEPSWAEDPCYLIVTTRGVRTDKAIFAMRTLEAVRGENYTDDGVSEELEDGYDPARGIYYKTQLLAVFDETKPGDEFRHWSAMPKAEVDEEDRKYVDFCEDDVFGVAPYYGLLTEKIKNAGIFEFIGICEKALGKIEMAKVSDGNEKGT